MKLICNELASVRGTLNNAQLKFMEVVVCGQEVAWNPESALLIDRLSYEQLQLSGGKKYNNRKKNTFCF